MTLFEVTPELQLLAKPVNPGWHKAELYKIDVKKSDDNKDLTIYTNKITDGPNKGRFLWVTVDPTSQESMGYALRYLNYLSGGEFLKPVPPGQKRKLDLNMNNAKKNFYIKVKNTEKEGQTYNNITDIADSPPTPVKK